MCFAFVLASCTSGGQKGESSNISNTGDVNSTVSDPDNSIPDDADQNSDNSSAVYGELKVDSTVSKPQVIEVRSDENTADMLNPEVMKKAGANKAALAMREKVLNSKDAVRVGGTTYYVSSKGSDSNDGRTPAAPFEKLTTAFAAAQEGDAVLLERGSVFRLGSTITLTNGVTYGAYGTGEKPEVWGSLENYAQPVRWQPYNIRNVWAIDFMDSDVGIIVFNHGEAVGNMQYYVRNLKKNGDFFFDNMQKVLYVYCDKGNPGNAYKDIEIGSRKILFRLRDGAENVTIDNIAFKYTGTFGIRGASGCRGINITNCIIGWIGGSMMESANNRFGNGIEFAAGCQDITVENCWIYQIYDAGFTFQITLPEGEEKEQTFKNINLKNNLIEYCSWAFEWWPTDSVCKIENISVTGNIMRFSGYGFAWDTRGPSHIRGAWSAKDFTARNFVISDNIFDCANGPVYAWALYSSEQFGSPLSGNSYYQRMPNSSYKSVFIFDLLEADTGAWAAKNQKQFDSVIAEFDRKAAVVKWLG